MEAPKSTIRRARSLRRRMTPPEARLWVALRRKAMEGWRFRRQHPIGPYVLDFYCDRARLAVEVDGQAHWIGNNQERDGARDAWMAQRGVRTLRLSATLIFEDLDAALRTIDHWARGGE
jgi:very-short-patch-repair endonuclease